MTNFIVPKPINIILWWWDIYLPNTNLHYFALQVYLPTWKINYFIFVTEMIEIKYNKSGSS